MTTPMTAHVATPLHSSILRVARGVSLIAVMSAALLSGACSGDLGLLNGDEPQTLAAAPGAPGSKGADAGTATAEAGKSELDKAIEYWGNQHKKDPKDLKAGLAFARNLKAAGHKAEAFDVVQALSMVHGNNRELASEYGRLALDIGQVQLAQQLLTLADDPTKPDWRVVSALGTVMAKQGKYAEAMPYYERALQLSPDQPSVLNNLAMAHAANGEPAKAEAILRQVAAKQPGDAKIQQNLALVLGLQAKHEEAQQVAVAGALPPAAAAANSDFMRSMVKAPEQTARPVTEVASKTPAVKPKPATTVATVKPGAMRDSAGPNAVSAPGWTTSVAKAE